MSDKRHFTIVINKKEIGLFSGRSPIRVARKVVSKLSKKGEKVIFSLRETTQGSKKKVYGPYEGYRKKLKEPVKVGDIVYKYESIVKKIEKKGGELNGTNNVNKNHYFEFEYTPVAIPDKGIYETDGPLKFRLIKKQKGLGHTAQFKVIPLTRQFPNKIYDIPESGVLYIFDTIKRSLVDWYYMVLLGNRNLSNQNRTEIEQAKKETYKRILQSLSDNVPKSGNWGVLGSRGVWSGFREKLKEEML